MNTPLWLALVAFLPCARAQDAQQDPPPAPVAEVEPSSGDQEPVEQQPIVTQDPALEPPAEQPPAPEPPAPRFDFTREIEPVDLAAELVRIAQQNEDLVSVASIGKSRAGRDILLVTVGDRRVGAPDRRPALFVTADLAADDTPRAGAQAGLFAVAELVARARDEADVAELLRRATVYIVPAPDPDALEDLVLHDPARISGAAISASMRLEREAGAHGRVGLNRNFPVGWQPFAPDVSSGTSPAPSPAAARPMGQGPYPLCEPESLALARCLLERMNVAACVLLTRRAGGLSACEPGVAEHDVVHTLDLAGELERAICSRAQLAHEPGSLPAFCEARLASLAFFAPAWEGLVQDARSGSAPAGFAHAFDLVLALLAELPRIEPGEPDIERLRPDLWQIDLPLMAGGALCITPRGPRPIEGLSIAVTGGVLELTALRRSGEAAFRPLDAARGATGEALRVEQALGTLESGAPLVVRLVVRAAPGTRLELLLGSSSAGAASVLALLE